MSNAVLILMVIPKFGQQVDAYDRSKNAKQTLKKLISEKKTFLCSSYTEIPFGETISSNREFSRKKGPQHFEKRQQQNCNPQSKNKFLVNVVKICLDSRLIMVRSSSKKYFEITHWYQRTAKVVMVHYGSIA